MLRFALLPDTAPVSISVRASRKQLVQIHIAAPLGFAGGLVHALSALSELASGLKTETRKAELARQTKERRSMWSRRRRSRPPRTQWVIAGADMPGRSTFATVRRNREAYSQRLMGVFLGLAGIGWVILAIQQGTVLGWVVAIIWIANKAAWENTVTLAPWTATRRSSAASAIGLNAPLASKGFKEPPHKWQPCQSASQLPIHLAALVFRCQDLRARRLLEQLL